MKRIIIPPPKIMCMYDYNYIKETLNLFTEIESLVNNGQLVTVDLRSVEKITAAASLLLFATTNKCQLFNKNENQVRFIFPTEKSNSQGHRDIVKTGLSRALCSGTKEKLQNLIDSGVYFQSAINPSKHIVQTVNFLTKNSKLDEVQFEMLTTAINEAMLNVSHHAYKNPLNDSEIHDSKVDFVDALGERWWQCAWYDELRCSWVFIIVDLGLGIPDTYKSQFDDAQIAGVKSSSVMEEAFTEGKSRFDDDQGRGNGSENIKQAISQRLETENLLVFSGDVKYEHNITLPKPKVANTDINFRGTLIEWTLCLRGINK